MQKFVINLEHRKDKRDLFKKNNPNLEVKFVIGINGSSETIWTNSNKYISLSKDWIDPFLNRPVQNTEGGCFLSHYTMWWRCIQENEPIIVIEDDVVINEKWNEEIYSKIIEGYEFLYLQHNENKKEKAIQINNFLVKPFYPYNTTAYVITPKAARKLVSTDILTNIIPVDEYLAKTIQSKILNAVALVEQSCRQLPRNSIPNDINYS